MNRVPLWLVLGAAAVAVIAGAAAWMAVFWAGRAGAPAAAAVHVQEQQELPAGPVVQLPKFVTNLAEPGTVIDVTFALVLRDERQRERVEQNEFLIRDAVLTVIRGKKASEVAGPEGKDRLAADVLHELERRLGSGVVQRVLVTDLITQP